MYFSQSGHKRFMLFALETKVDRIDDEMLVHREYRAKLLASSGNLPTRRCNASKKSLSIDRGILEGMSFE
jgi:hypothetical protein